MNELKRALDEILAQRRHIFDTEAQPLLDIAKTRTFTADEAKRSDEVSARIETIDRAISQLRGQINTEEQRAALGLGAPHGGGSGEFGSEMRDLLLGRRMEPVELPAPIDRAAVKLENGMRVRALSTPGQGAATIGVGIWGSIVEGMQNGSGLLKVANMVATSNGEPFIVPRGAVGTADLTAEGATITGTDPSFAGTTLRAYKVAQLVAVNREFLEDTDAWLEPYIAKQAGEALGIKMGNLLVNGTGLNATTPADSEPAGLLLGATAGLTGPTGTATTFGAQATAGQGTDLINNLYASVAEPYAASPSAAFLGRNATITAIKNLKTSAGDPVGTAFVAGGAGAPFVPDAYMPAPAANALSLAFGAWDRFWVRMVGSLRFERSDQAAFADDKVLFKAVARFDGALIDPAAIRFFKHSAT